MTDNNPNIKTVIVSPQVVAALITGLIAIVAALLPFWLERASSPPPTATPVPSATQMAIIPSSTPIPASATPQTRSTQTTILPTDTPIPETPTPEPNVILLYDDVSFTVYNDSQQTLSLEGVQFRSDNRRWDASQWGASLVADFPSDNCLRMRDATSGNRQPPAICGNLLGFMQVGGSALFWLDSASFEVRANGDLITTCDTATSRCPVYIPQ